MRARTKEEVGEALKALRGDKSSLDICNTLNISRSAWQNYEAGIRMPRDDIKGSIADYFGVTVDSIFYC